MGQPRTPQRLPGLRSNGVAQPTVNALLEAVDDGRLSARFVLLCALKYMGEIDTKRMADANALLDDTEETEDV